MKSASCTTTSLFIVIFSKNSFFIRSLDSETVLQQRSFSKADAKVVSFTIQSKSFYKKCAQKHIVFDLFYIFEQKQRKFTFYIFIRAKETVDGNRGVGNEREGEIKGAFLGEKEKKGKGEEARIGWNEGEWRECRGR